jgi:histidinol dehydrogenase
VHTALERLDPEVRAGLEESIARLRRTCTAERGDDTRTEVVPGGTVEQRLVPVRRVGLYVPGGLAPLVSSVLMNVVPAQVAGVPSLAVSSPPQREHGGQPHPTILAACALLGVEEVYAVGGAQAIAMFAYGAGPMRPRSTWSPVRATSTWWPPSGCSRAVSASTPRRVRPRSPSSPTTAPAPFTSRPTW